MILQHTQQSSITMKTFTVILLCALVAYAKAGSIQTVDIANRYAHVGAHGPALINLPPRFQYPTISHQRFTIGPPHGTTLIGIEHGLYNPHGFTSPAQPGLPLNQHHEGSYIAETRGSVHIAPLIGHAKSFKSMNLEPAPYTIW